ncbi:MAG: hypothetical protein RLZZ546_305 [Bacteroidota bacterium]|jgi:hypothetical protein
MVIVGCGKDDNPQNVESYFFDCLDNINVDSLKPSLYTGLPITCKNEVFIDLFSTNENAWSEFKNSTEGIFEVINGKYSIQTANYNSFFTRRSLEKFPSNFEMEVDFKFTQSLNKSSFFGLTFLGQEWEYYMLGYNLENKAVLAKSIGQNMPLQIVKSVTTQTYLNEFNKLTVRRIDNMLYFFINENLVFSLNNLEGFGADFGFRLPGNSKLEIDNLKIYRWGL